MIQALIFTVTIFLGWVLFDAIKHRKVHMENVWAGLVTAIVAGIVWYILFVIF